MESNFSLENFSCLAEGFRRIDQDASRARIFSWSAHEHGAVLKQNSSTEVVDITSEVAQMEYG